jgi:uncharacterized protein YbjT (DUF2867 family)
MKIVVIGGSGLIGTKLVNKLRHKGHEVAAASPSSGDSASAIPRDFPAVTLPALIGAALTFWALYASRAGRSAPA